MESDLRRWMRLVESFDSPLAWDWWDARHRAVVFNIGEREYTVRFSPTEANIWEVDFFIGKFDFGRSKTGNQFSVIGTIIDIIQAFLLEQSPNQLYFTANQADGGRAKLYAQLLRKMAPTLARNGYTANIDADQDDGGRKFDAYQIIRSGLNST